MFRSVVVAYGLLAGAAAVAQPSPDQPARAIAGADLAAAFGAREGIEQIDLSPSGKRLVYLTPAPGAGTAVVVHDLSPDKAQVVLRTDGQPERLRWCNFVTDEQLICRMTGLAKNGDAIIPFDRLVSVGADGRDPKMLGQRESFYDAYLRQHDGRIIDWLLGQENEILMSRVYIPEAGRSGTRMVRRAEGLGVDRVDVRSLRVTQVEAPNAEASSYLSDGRGNVRIMSSVDLRGSTGQLGTRINYFYRVAGNKDWRPFGTYDFQSGSGMRPIAVDPHVNAAYVLQKLNGRDALYRVKLDGSMATELVHANDRVDVDGVVRAERGSRVIGVTFAEESRRVVYFDTDYETTARLIARAIPDLPLIDFVASSADGRRLLIHAGSDSDPGRYFTFDRDTRNLNEILLDRPALEGLPLANVRPVQYPASDGTLIPAYLTLPPGGDGRNLPGIVLPHGGPAARDEWGFDWLSQYFAQLGFAVLQPNYRGSAGYGEDWLRDNGFRSWRTSIGDITAGARWLSAQGIADPGRLAIIGWSYGGYAALQAGATEPDLFRAVVAIAPVTDLQQLKEDTRFFANARNTAEYIGSGPHVREGSPLRNAERIKAPVLMFHGDRDLNVRVVHARQMDEALRAAGRSSELVVFPDLEHDLASSAARSEMLDKIRLFLDRHVPD